MAIVFVSSTYLDLVKYRRAVIDAIKIAGWQSLEMESFGARPQEPETVCLEEIAEADVFVGIYAYRYGFVPEGSETSIIQREYEYARERQKPILCYLVDEEFPWNPKMFCSGNDKVKLDSFKNMVKKNHVVMFFTTADDLATKVVGGVTREMERLQKQRPGQRIILTADTDTRDVLKCLGVDPHALYASQAQQLRIKKKLESGNKVKAGELRKYLLRGGGKILQEPFQVTVQGIIQPLALMHSGWWEEGMDDKKYPVRGLQEWLFHGLQEWAPSWDYTWQLDKPETLRKSPFHLGQIADDLSDEAESIPVYIPSVKAVNLTAELLKNPGGLEVEITGLMAHRDHFCLEPSKDGRRGDCSSCPQQLECLVETRFGGALDYCLQVDAENRTHQIKIGGPAQFYSGYLWKCLVPKRWAADPVQATLKDSFFIWEHTNFADADARSYNLDSLDRKQAYLEKKYGEMHFIQKSSSFVPGSPVVPSGVFFNQLFRKYKRII
jgi:hypothetical protein